MERGSPGQGAPSNVNNAGQLRVQQLVEVLNSPTATQNQKAQAGQVLISMLSSPSTSPDERAFIQRAMGQSNWWVANGRDLMYGKGAVGNGSVMQPKGGDDMSSQTIDPRAYERNQWRAARQATENMAGLPPGSNVAPDPRDMTGPYATGGGSTPGSQYDVGTSSADANSVGSSMDGYDNTFFSGIQSGALNDVANNTDAAAKLWRTRGGPGGGSLANSSASIYGEDDFMAAMNMAELMGNPNQVMAPQDKLKFTNDWMGNAQQGGNYVDPGKLASQLLGNIGQVQDPFMQEELIDKAILALRPYMTETSFKMLASRLNRINDEYTTYGLENGTADLSNVLLNEVYKALGV